MSLGSHGIKEDGFWKGKLGRILEVVLQNLAVEGFRKDVCVRMSQVVGSL
jgi:uncharacterized protein (DUF3820 family)